MTACYREGRQFSSGWFISQQDGGNGLVTKEKLNNLLLARDEAKRALGKLAHEFSASGYPGYYKMVKKFIRLMDEAYGIV